MTHSAGPPLSPGGSAYSPPAGSALSPPEPGATTATMARRYQRLLEADVIGVLVATTDGQIVEANDRFLRMVGFSAADVRRGMLRWDDLTPPGWEAVDSEALREIRATGACTPFEKEYLHREGRRVPVRLTAAMVEGASGECICLVEDLTERHRAESARRAVEDDYRILFEAASDGILVCDRDGLLVRGNAAVWRMLGYDPDAPLPLHVADLVEDQELARIAPEIMRVVPGALTHSEWQLRRRSGGRLTVEVSATALPDGRLLGILRDVTARREAEDALHASEAHLRAIIEHEPDCVKLVSPSGALMDMNPAGLAILEADSVEQVRGMSMRRCIVPEHQARFESVHRQVMRGERGSLTFEIIGLKGTRRWLETQAVPLHDAQGQVVALLGLTRDITERRLAEEELRESREELRALADRLNSVREEEARRIARELHDELGQRLTAMKMAIHHLQKHEPRQAPRMREEWDDLQSQVSRTIAVVQELSNELRFGHLDLLGLPAAVEWQLRAFEQASRIACAVDVPDHVSVTRAEATAILRVLQEAMTNVARHAEATALAVSLDDTPEGLVLTIRDNGLGITATRSRARAHRSLGLLGMRERATAIGAVLEVADAPSGGTIVRLTLPWQRGGA